MYNILNINILCWIKHTIIVHLFTGKKLVLLIRDGNRYFLQGIAFCGPYRLQTGRKKIKPEMDKTGNALHLDNQDPENA
jgi:hypothetical protein